MSLQTTEYNPAFDSMFPDDRSLTRHVFLDSGVREAAASMMTDPDAREKMEEAAGAPAGGTVRTAPQGTAVQAPDISSRINAVQGQLAAHGGQPASSPAEATLFGGQGSSMLPSHDRISKMLSEEPPSFDDFYKQNESSIKATLPTAPEGDKVGALRGALLGLADWASRYGGGEGGFLKYALGKEDRRKQFDREQPEKVYQRAREQYGDRSDAWKNRVSYAQTLAQWTKNEEGRDAELVTSLVEKATEGKVPPAALIASFKRIRDANKLNVSDDKIEAIVNSTSPAGPMYAVTKGQDGKPVGVTDRYGKYYGDKEVPQDASGLFKDQVSQWQAERARDDKQFRERMAMQAGAQASATANAMTAQRSALRKEYLDHPVIKNFNLQQQAMDRITAAAGDPGPAGDISLVYAYMKMMDPTSTVREGEFATAQNAGSVANNITAAYNKAVNGERLTPELRTQFVNQARAQYNSTLQRKAEVDKFYGDVSQAEGLDTSRTGAKITPTGVQQPAAAGGAATPKVPTVVNKSTGEVMQLIGGKWVSQGKAHMKQAGAK